MEIQDYPNYLIYDDGRVYNKKYNRFIKPTIVGKGYLQLALFKNGERKMFRINRLVSLHYIPNPENKPEVNHIDGDKTNNNIKNLEWMTRMENANAFQPIRQDNTSGVKNIYYHKQWHGWVYIKTINKIRHTKYFKTFEEAVEYKNNI